MENRGLIHVYCGDGKGKTTSALGLSLRAVGAGMKVVIIQFLKGRKTSELVLLNHIPDITVLRCEEVVAFSFAMSEEEKQMAARINTENLEAGIELAESGRCDLLILDEVISAFTLGLVNRQLLEKLVRYKPEPLELVLTGRNPEPWMLECADYVTEMKKIKHPFDRGIKARLGIEK